MTCKHCSRQMRLADQIYDYEDTCEEYYVCDLCHTTCIVRTRHGKYKRVTWSKEDEE